MVEFVVVDQHLVLAGDLVSSHVLLGLDLRQRGHFTGVLKRGCHQPTILILEQLVYTHLMAFAQVLEAGMIDQIGTSVLSGDDGVMAL